MHTTTEPFLWYIIMLSLSLLDGFDKWCVTVNSNTHCQYKCYSTAGMLSVSHIILVLYLFFIIVLITPQSPFSGCSGGFPSYHIIFISRRSLLKFPLISEHFRDFSSMLAKKWWRWGDPDEDHVIWLKVPEQLLKGPWEIFCQLSFPR